MLRPLFCSESFNYRFLRFKFPVRTNDVASTTISSVDHECVIRRDLKSLFGRRSGSLLSRIQRGIENKCSRKSWKQDLMSSRTKTFRLEVMYWNNNACTVPWRKRYHRWISSSLHLPILIILEILNYFIKPMPTYDKDFQCNNEKLLFW